jgi:hypothetical protein
MNAIKKHNRTLLNLLKKLVKKRNQWKRRVYFVTIMQDEIIIYACLTNISRVWWNPNIWWGYLHTNITFMKWKVV